MTTPLLEIKNLHARVEGNEILKGVNLTVQKGEVHSIMGPNGSGKSTLACVLAGHDAYEVTEGEIFFNGIDLLELDADQRACAGIFLAFQYPVEIPGVSTKFFLKAAVNAIRKYRGQEELDAMDFLDLIEEKAASVKLTSRSRRASTANSIGNSRNTSLQNPFTIMLIASSVEIPR